jgi:hypothetical protein
VRATGRVVAVPGKPIRFCAPVAEPAIGYEPGMEPAPAYCDLGIDVVGVDMTKLNQPRSKEGATEGQATLEGTYKAGVVTVDKQGPPEYDNTPLPDNPPCPPPPGGWPTSRPQDILEPGGAENIEIAAVEKYRAAHPGVIADVAMLRPSDKQVLLLVLANRDVEAVDAALRPAYGERLCVTRAAFTPAEAERARTEIQSNLSGTGRLGIFGVGTGLSRSAQMVIVMQVVMVTEELVALRDRYAPGLVELRPWLQRF